MPERRSTQRDLQLFPDTLFELCQSQICFLGNPSFQCGVMSLKSGATIPTSSLGLYRTRIAVAAPVALHRALGEREQDRLLCSRMPLAPQCYDSLP